MTRFSLRKSKNYTEKFSCAGNFTKLKNKHFTMIGENKWDPQKEMAKIQIYFQKMLFNVCL